MAIYSLKTLADLISAVREELQENENDANAMQRIKRDINMVYSEIVAAKRWWWMVEQTTVEIPKVYKVGTARVIHGSSTVKFSETVNSPKEGYLFSVDGDNQIYIVESHTPGSDEIKLSQRYTGASNMAVGYKIWMDHIPLPTNAKETVEVSSPFTKGPLENFGMQEYRRFSSTDIKREGTPEIYYTGDYIEVFPDEAIDDMPDLMSKGTQGIVKTLIFEAALPASITVGTALRIKAANTPSFNGDIKVAKISTTNVANDTLIYSGKEEFTEPQGADHNLQVRRIITTADRSRYRMLYFYPAINNDNQILMLDYQKNVPPLELDTDEPLLPLDDRIVIVYGALHRAWSRMRNPEEAQRNVALYRDTLARMSGYIQDSLDKPLLQTSRTYLGHKRNSFRSRRFNISLAGFVGPSGSTTGGSAVVLGTPDTVAIFNSDGELEGSSVVSVTELNYLDGADSNIQAQIDAIDANLASPFVTNALVSPTAAIARSKLAAGTADKVVITNGSGIMTESSVTPTELQFLAGASPLASVTLVDNTAVAAPAIAIPLANTFCFIVYSILRDIEYEGGLMILLNDGAVASLTLLDGAIGVNGVTLSADVSGGNVRVLYTTSNTGDNATLKYAVLKWAA